MITATLKLERHFLQDVEMNFPGVPVVGQFVTLPLSMVDEEIRKIVMHGEPVSGRSVFSITRVEWEVDRFLAPARMVVHMEYEGGV